MQVRLVGGDHLPIPLVHHRGDHLSISSVCVDSIAVGMVIYMEMDATDFFKRLQSASVPIPLVHHRGDHLSISLVHHLIV